MEEMIAVGLHNYELIEFVGYFVIEQDHAKTPAKLRTDVQE